MPETVRDPIARRKYLREADYYRLAYQLCAQLMNAEFNGEGKKEGFFKPLDILYGYFPRSSDATTGTSVRAKNAAECFLGEVREVLAWYARRRRAKWWTRQVFPKLKAKDLRLEEFLTRTVEPCLDLVVAASLRWEGDASRAEERVERLREKAAEKKSEISYRTHYNLACYEAGSENDQGTAEALQYLERALREAPADRQEELAGWAERDPSLSELSENSRFKELLTRFQPEESQQETKASAGGR